MSTKQERFPGPDVGLDQQAHPCRIAGEGDGTTLSSTHKVTTERIDRAIKTVAEAMVEHNLPGLLVYIRRLEAERDRLLQEVDAIDYASQILRKSA
jgi:hypothetical protein